MLTEQVLVEKFTSLVKERCPYLGNLLQNCHVELVNSYWGRPAKLSQHFVVYCPEHVFPLINPRKLIFRGIAKNLGIPEAICMNATRIIRDPASTLKDKDPVLWLELQWIVSTPEER